jgi:kinesin family protein C2/C3
MDCCSQVEYDMRVQMLEIYNETLRDLLVEGAAASAASNKLDILNTQASGCNVPGSTKVRSYVSCTLRRAV